MIDPTTHQVLAQDVPTVPTPIPHDVQIYITITVAVFLLVVVLGLVWLGLNVTRQSRNVRKFKRFDGLPLDATEREVLLHTAAYHKQFAEGLNTKLYADDRLSPSTQARIKRHTHLAETIYRIATRE